jgi:hypothetical protein
MVAAWLGGSLGRGDADDFSDIDLHLAIADAACAQLTENRRGFVSQFGDALLIQEAPQNAPPDGAFLLVLYRGQAAPVEVDWSWRAASAAAIPDNALILFDGSPGLRSSSLWRTPSDDEISLGTTFFWAMAFIVAKKLARGDTVGAFDLLRAMRRARDRVQDYLAGQPAPPWGAIPAPAVPLPPPDRDGQRAELIALLDQMARLQPTTWGAGGLVTVDATRAIRRFVDEMTTD